MNPGRHAVHRCERCGTDTWAQFCRDCRDVDPVMTAGGLTSRQMRDKQRLVLEREELVHSEIVSRLALAAEHRNSAAKRAERLRRTIQEREKRIGLVAA